MSTFVNGPFGYTVVYPAQWHLVVFDGSAQVQANFLFGAEHPEAAAFDIRCFKNPHGLGAQEWWQQNSEDTAHESAQGIHQLASGVIAYVAAGQGQVNYTVYTVTAGQRACQIVAFDTKDRIVASQIHASVNSFQWY